MQRKSFILRIFSILGILILLGCRGCSRTTPNEYLNHTAVSKELYQKDKLRISRQLIRLLKSREGFFDNSFYVDSTKIIIDSIIYSPDLKKLGVFVVAKTPNSKLPMPKKDYDWVYDATCYIGIKQKDSIDLSWIGPSFTNSHDLKKMSNIIRRYYFREFATNDKSRKYEFNLNDIRFWKSQIWKQIEIDKKSRLKFEELKIKHPEDVYEPKK